MTVRKVNLVYGAHDGSQSLASDSTAIVSGEVYVHDGGNDPDRFVHAKTVLSLLPEEQQRSEYARVKAWMEHPGEPSGIFVGDGRELRIPQPMSVLIGIPPWRIAAWYQLIQLGEGTEHCS